LHIPGRRELVQYGCYIAITELAMKPLFHIITRSTGVDYSIKALRFFSISTDYDCKELMAPNLMFAALSEPCKPMGEPKEQLPDIGDTLLG
jgi:hypothetical protein